MPAVFSTLSYEGMYGVGAAVTLLGKREDQITKAGHIMRLIDADSIDLRVMIDIAGPLS